jgi:tetratricopeptide (TPR) repeat protein
MLKNKPILLLLLFLGTFQQLKSQVSELFDEANQLYEKGSYQEAFELYDSIEKMSFYSPELYLNKANTAFKLDSLVHAIFYYEKAIKLNPSIKEAIQNLEFANTKLFGDKVPIHSKSVSHWISQFFEGNYELLAWLATIFSILLAVLITLKIISKKLNKKRIIPSLITLSIIGFVTTFSLAFVIYNYSVNNYAAIVFDSEAEIMNEPSINSNITLKIERGSKISILDVNEQWFKIEFNSKIGWVIKERVKVI